MSQCLEIRGKEEKQTFFSLIKIKTRFLSFVGMSEVFQASQIRF